MATKKQVFRCMQCGKESDTRKMHHTMPMEAQQPFEEERVEYTCKKCGYSSATSIKHHKKMMKLTKKPK